MSERTFTGGRGIVDAPGAQWDALARAAASSDGPDAVPVIRRELLTCMLGGSPYAISVERVREIVRLRPLTPMPRTPDWLIGVISLRGEVVQVVDLRMRLGLPTTEPTRTSRIIVLHGEDDRVTGVLVDAVREVLRVDADAIRPSTAAELRAVQEICRNGDEFVSIIEIDRVWADHAG